MADSNSREIAATVAAAIIAKADHGSLPAEDAVAVYLDVLSVLEKKALTTEARREPTKIADVHQEPAASTQKEIYRSENGDRWFLCRQDNGHAFVEHKANLPSGGKVTPIEIGDFLGNDHLGPEHQALIRLIGNAVEKPRDAS